MLHTDIQVDANSSESILLSMSNGKSDNYEAMHEIIIIKEWKGRQFLFFVVMFLFTKGYMTTTWNLKK